MTDELVLPERFSIFVCLKKGVKSIPENFWTQLACTLVLIGIMAGLQAYSAAQPGYTESVDQLIAIMKSPGHDLFGNLMRISTSSAGRGQNTLLLTELVPFLVLAPLFVGVAFVFLKIKRRQKTNPLDMKKGFDHYFVNVGVYVVKTVALLVFPFIFGIVALVVCGIAKNSGADNASCFKFLFTCMLPGLLGAYLVFVLFILSPFVLAESRLGVWGTLKVTYRITWRKFFGLLVLIGIFFVALGIPLVALIFWSVLVEAGVPWEVLVALALTLIVSTPVSFSGAAHAYECLKLGRTPEEILRG